MQPSYQNYDRCTFLYIQQFDPSEAPLKRFEQNYTIFPLYQVADTIWEISPPIEIMESDIIILIDDYTTYKIKCTKFD